jgi:2-polyprenyl-6-methoxyphenol hydroxylase-like FAD-dependent oxidoreductase
MTPPNTRKHAVVLGAGMAGLLAARVLSEFYETVTIVERDTLSSDPVQRKGIPQGHHVHAFMSAGSHVLGQLFPGLLDELVDAGADVWNDGDLSRVCLRFGGYAFKNSGRFADPPASATYLATRPFLETHVRRRVRAIDNVLILDGHDAVAPVAEAPHRVAGVGWSTAKPVMRPCSTPSWWLMRWAVAHPRQRFSTAWATVGRQSSDLRPAWPTPVS